MLNIHLMRAGVEQRLRHPVAVALLGAFILLAVLGIVVNRGADGLEPLNLSMISVLVLGAGMIGLDVRSGVLQLLLARPVTRTEYVMSRWFAVGTCSAAISLTLIAGGTAVLSTIGSAPTAPAVLSVACRAITTAYGMAAVMVLLSSLASAFADLGLLLLGLLAGTMFEGIGEFSEAPRLIWLGRELRSALAPELDPFNVLTSTPISWHAIVSYFSTVTLCLAVALFVFNRKEISYAAS